MKLKNNVVIRWLLFVCILATIITILDHLWFNLDKKTMIITCVLLLFAQLLKKWIDSYFN